MFRAAAKSCNGLSTLTRLGVKFDSTDTLNSDRLGLWIERSEATAASLSVTHRIQTNPMPVSPTIPRTMAFVDGENLVARYQAMLSSPRVPQSGVVHTQDAFVWRADTPVPGWLDVVRAYYYTSVVGEQSLVDATADALQRLPFTTSGVPSMQCLLLPRVFKRPTNTRKTSTVDINLTVDMLSHAAQGSADTFYLMSGDGDFVPLVDAIVARGCRVIVAAFSSGLSKSLKRRADRFIDLDATYFLPIGG